MDDPGHKATWEGIFWHPGRCFHQPHSMCKKNHKKLTSFKNLNCGHLLCKKHRPFFKNQSKWLSEMELNLTIFLCATFSPFSSSFLSPFSSSFPLSVLMSPSSLFSLPPSSSPSSTQINFSLHSRPSFEQLALTGVGQDTLSSNLLLSTKVAWIHLSMTTGLCLWLLMHVSYAVNTPVQRSTGPEPTFTSPFEWPWWWQE